MPSFTIVTKFKAFIFKLYRVQEAFRPIDAGMEHLNRG